MQHLNLYMVQADLAWENVDENLRHLGHLMQGIEDSSLVLLPEMFATGFTMKPEQFSQKMNGKAVEWLVDVSNNKAVCGSLSVEENGKFYNRLFWAENGKIRITYDKRHLFSFGQEPRHYVPGTQRVLLDYQGWKIAPFVCYDLRFPVWCRNTDEADFMFFVANWPQVRIKAWEKLLQARAIENQCYVAGINRVGEDGHGVYHNGASMLCDAWGEVLSKTENNEAVIHAILNANALMEYRMSFPVLKDRDDFVIRGI